MAKSYTQRKDQINAIMAAKSLQGRDIGELPKVTNKRRKNRCKDDFQLFCVSYFSNLFTKPFSKDHIRVIEAIERTALAGGLQAIAMPRGSGKSTLCEVAAIWCLVYGLRRFVVLIGATETASQQTLSNIKMELETNERLLQDFPEAVYPIVKLEGIANRTSGQLYKGTRTRIGWTANEVTLPTIKGSVCSGSAIRVAGITGRLRGMKISTAEGKSLRPDFVLLDDIQTTESANSTQQTKKRLEIVNGDVLGLAGVGSKIAGMMPITVISKGDLADTLLDRKTHPDWNGERTKLLYEFPTNKDLWEKYEDIRADSLRESGTIEKATFFYTANRKAMDEGAVVAWEERYNPDEKSAVQNAMNLYIQDKRSFFAEYQNEPLAEDFGITDKQLTTQDLKEKVNGLGKSVVPLFADRLTMYIDVQKPCLFYAVCAFNSDFTASVIEYGTYPEQTASRFDVSNLRTTLQDVFQGMSFEAQIYKGLENLIASKLGNEYYREDGLALKIEKCLLDANWGESTEIVYQFCRQSLYSPFLLPAHGKGISAANKPISQYTKKAGDKFFHDCYIPSAAGKRAMKHIIIDANSWKSFVATRITVPMGEKSCLSLYGTPKTNHDLLFDHLTSEYHVLTAGNGRTLKEWKLKPNRENHWWDCLCGCFVGANVLGCTIPEFQPMNQTKARISLKEKQSGTVPLTIVEDDQIQGKTGKLSLKELQARKRK